MGPTSRIWVGIWGGGGLFFWIFSCFYEILKKIFGGSSWDLIGFVDELFADRSAISAKNGVFKFQNLAIIINFLKCFGTLFFKL